MVVQTRLKKRGQPKSQRRTKSGQLRKLRLKRRPLRRQRLRLLLKLRKSDYVWRKKNKRGRLPQSFCRNKLLFVESIISPLTYILYVVIFDYYFVLFVPILFYFLSRFQFSFSVCVCDAIINFSKTSPPVSIRHKHRWRPREI